MNSFSLIQQCPECNRVLNLKSAHLSHWHCQCGCMLFLAEDGSLKTTLIHSISSFLEIIKPGTKGSWNGNAFTVSGRFRLWFIENVFNYWTIELQDGSIKILGEAYGLYAIYEKIDFREIILFTKLNALQNNKSIWLGNTEYEFIRKNEVRFWDAEGDFYKPLLNIRCSFELMSPERNQVEIFELESDSFELYSVQYTSFESLQLYNLREQFDAGKKFLCESCGAETIVKLFPYSQCWTCNTCNSAHYYFNGGQRLETSVPKLKPIGVFKIGDSLWLNDIGYEVLGYALKEDSQENYQWKEYTLFNRNVGFAFLNESDGHWTLLKETGDSPNMRMARAKSFEFNDRTFQLFNAYGFKIAQASGAFSGNIFNDSYKLYAKDFIAPPYILCVEQGDREHTTWFMGEHIATKELKKQTNQYLPVKMSIGPAEPKAMIELTFLVKCTLLVLLLLIGIHFLIGYNQQEKVLLNYQYTMADSLPQQTFISDEFELTKWKSNLQFDIYAPVDNSWFELEATLINKVTGDEYGLQQGVEQYHGVTEGESWSEGGNQETVYLSSIPSGKYILKITAVRDMYSYALSGGKMDNFSLKVTNDVPMQRNFWLIVLVVLIWPVYKFFTMNYYEQRRWESSPYSPYTSSY